MKVFAISKDKMYYRIGDTPDTKDWYTRTETVSKELETVNKLDEVKLSFEKDDNGKKLITSIEVTKKGEISSSSDNVSGNGSSKFRSPEEIRKDETLRSASLAIQAMPGQFENITSLTEALCSLYDKLLEKTK
jgi:hypothetical protein